MCVDGGDFHKITFTNMFNVNINVAFMLLHIITLILRIMTLAHIR